MSEERTFPNEAAAVTEARRWVLLALGDLVPGVGESIAVMVSELAANAVRHTASDFTVNVSRGDSEVRIAVTDSGPGSPTLRGAPQRTEPSGRGLQLVSALAAEWGVIPSEAATGKTVWFTVSLQPHTDEPVAAGEMARPYESYALDTGGLSRSTAVRDVDGGDAGETAAPRARTRELVVV